MGQREKVARRALAGIAGCALLVVVIVGIDLAEGGEPPAKRAFLEAEATQQAIYQSVTHAPKDLSTPVPSCPVDVQALKSKTGIRLHPEGRIGPGGITPANYAFVLSGRGVPYLVYAGGDVTDAEQGTLMVWEQTLDPCADIAAGRNPQPQYFNTPFRAGSVRITEIDGDELVFVTSTGRTGRFNYVTGQFR